jgi:hypothetical protein
VWVGAWFCFARKADPRLRECSRFAAFIDYPQKRIALLRATPRFARRLSPYRLTTLRVAKRQDMENKAGLGSPREAWPPPRESAPHFRAGIKDNKNLIDFYCLPISCYITKIFYCLQIFQISYSQISLFSPCLFLLHVLYYKYAARL